MSFKVGDLVQFLPLEKFTSEDQYSIAGLLLARGYSPKAVWKVVRADRYAMCDVVDPLRPEMVPFTFRMARFEYAQVQLSLF